MLRQLRLAVFSVLALAAAACGDDSDPSGSGGSGGSSSSSSVASTGSASSSAQGSASQGSTSGEGGGGGAPGTGGATGTGGGEQGGGGSGGGEDGASFDVAWSLLVGPQTVDCFFLGGETVDVYYQRDGEEAVVETHSCFDEGITSDPLPYGDYQVTATLHDFEGDLILGSDPVSVTLGADGADVDLEFATPGARIAASWSIVDGDLDATCNDAGAGQAEVSLFDVNTGLGYGASFDCALGVGLTGWFPLGNYDVSMNLLDFDVIVVGGEISSIALQEPDETFTLPEVVFDLAADQ